MEASCGRKRARPSSRLPISALLSAPVDIVVRSCAACLCRPVTDGRSCDECATGSFCCSCLAAYIRAAVEDTALLPLRCGETNCRAIIPVTALSASGVGDGLTTKYAIAVREKEKRTRRVRRRLEGTSGGRSEGDETSIHGDDEDEAMVLDVLRANSWQRCPDCGTGVERVFGCRHMRCVCGGQFCYGCGGRWVGGVCERRCGLDAGLAALLANPDALLENPNAAGVDSGLWEGLRDQIWRRMLQIATRLQELQGQSGRRMEIVAHTAPTSPVRRRPRRSRGLSVEELVHSVDAAVVTGGVNDCVGLPRVAVPLSPLLLNSLAENRSTISPHRSMALHFLMN